MDRLSEKQIIEILVMRRSAYPKSPKGIVRGRIVGPFFINGNLNSEKYLDLLRNHIIPSCMLLLVSENDVINEQLWFKQEWAPPHFATNHVVSQISLDLLKVLEVKGLEVMRLWDYEALEFYVYEVMIGSYSSFFIICCALTVADHRYRTLWSGGKDCVQICSQKIVQGSEILRALRVGVNNTYTKKILLWLSFQSCGHKPELDHAIQRKTQILKVDDAASVLALHSVREAPRLSLRRRAIETEINATKFLTDKLDELPLSYRTRMFFQQDGCPAHHAVTVRNWLNSEFNEHWIGRDGPILWSPRSPNLTILDFYLLGRLNL
ncbi:hypothetical protein NQ318_009195 [Aromia moschata]|uniref:Uncharacterized protein n=1 Tax=Aromia moschata TaxID=1265417 RepID=A0AAV8Y3R3_9CUCU|nr:hypothetical protein NQ318_009195 [Aromia moschata]